MNQPSLLIRNVSDTALWVAVYRARETERPDAVFRDPFARRLAGERGEKIASSMRFAEKHTWPYTARTWLGDRIIAEQVRQGTDLVLNLAAGLDTRPYRMDLPVSLPWVEVDLPGILAYKEEILRDEKPVCRLERVALDLADRTARRELFASLAGRAQRVLVNTEGLLVYLSEEEVAALAEDLAAQGSFRAWTLDVASPALLRMLKRQLGASLEQAGAPLKFAPADGPAFFTRYGWQLQEAHSVLHTAAELRRLPFFLRLMAKIASPQFNARRPWSAVCLFTRQQAK